MSRFLLLVPALLLVANVEAAPNSRIRAIRPIKDTQPTPAAFRSAPPTKPVVLKSVKDAAKYFDKANLARLQKQVDFKQQTVLVFAWRGSSRDQFGYHVAESYPEQIHFDYKRGLTDDLKHHVHVFALRANVKWRVRLLR